MVTAGSTTRPKLLMLAHRLPQPHGDDAQVRAWNLLNAARTSHDVDLACATPAAVSLAQWMPLHERTHRLAMIRPAWWSRCVHWFDRASSDEKACSCHVDLQRELQCDGEYDTLLCTHRILWNWARTIHTHLRICDVAGAGAEESASVDERQAWDMLMLGDVHELAHVRRFTARKIVVPAHQASQRMREFDAQPAMSLISLLANRSQLRRAA